MQVWRNNDQSNGQKFCLRLAITNVKGGGGFRIGRGFLTLNSVTFRAYDGESINSYTLMFYLPKTDYCADSKIVGERDARIQMLNQTGNRTNLHQTAFSFLARERHVKSGDSPFEFNYGSCYNFEQTNYRIYFFQ